MKKEQLKKVAELLTTESHAATFMIKLTLNGYDKTQFQNLLSNSNDVKKFAKIVHEEIWDLATLDMLSITEHQLNNIINILIELHKDKFIDDRALEQFAYAFCIEGLEYTYLSPGKTGKQKIHYDFPIILETALKIFNERTDKEYMH